MRARLLPFVLVLFAVSAILHGYVAYRLLIGLAGLTPSVALSIALVLSVMHVGLLILGHGRHSDLAAVTGDTWLGVVFQLFVWCLLTEPLRLVLWLSGVDSRPRDVISGIVALVLAAAALAWGAYRALGPVRPKYVEITLPRLPAALDGLRVVQIADTHCSPYLGPAWMRRVVRAANAQQPDIVCHTGDLADGPTSRRTPAIRELSKIQAPQRFFITGNHEYFTDAEYWGRTMTELDWNFLHNRHHRFERDGASLVIAGIDDPTGAARGIAGHGPHLDAALEGVGHDECVLLLAHQPAQLKDAVRHGGIDLQLSGHTHGGQMWPFHYLVRLDQKIVAGLARRGDTQIYVSRGVGFWGPPFRIGAPPELTVITLRSGSRT